VIDDASLTEPTYTVTSPLTPGMTYYWRVRAELPDGGSAAKATAFGPWSPIRSFTVAVGTAVDGVARVPASFTLHHAYPNPFNPATTIGYELGQPAHIHLEVFDALGRQVASLVDAYRPAGYHAVTWDAGGSPSGAYVVTLRAGEFVQSRRVLLAK
jgi:hypothetical protein